MMLPAAMRFNLSVAPDKFLRMARLVDPTAVSGEAFIDWIVALRQAIGIPASLDALGVTTGSNGATRWGSAPGWLSPTQSTPGF